MKKGKGKFLLADVLAAIFAVTLVLNPFSATYAAAQEEKSKQETAQKEKEQVRKAFRLKPMTVTAQKREENVQDVPIGISVFSDIQIKDAAVENTFDLIQFSPNVHMQNNYSEHVIVIRGISSFNTSIYSPAGYYVDDVSYPLHYMHNAELFDVERAEILRGPQGTMYGRNSESGVINIITKQPDNEFRGKVFGEYGNYNTFRSGANMFQESKGTVTKIMTETPRKGSRTLMQYNNVDYNIGLSDALFEQSNLKR